MMRTKTLVASAVLLLGTWVKANGVPVLDGVIGPAEYAHSVVVDSTPDLGGVYDPGTSGSFAGGPVNCHDDWTLLWDFDATFLYFAADPMGAPSNCADNAFSMHLLPVTGNPNDSPTGCEQCTGTFFDNNLYNFHAAAECSGGGLDFYSEFEFGTSPPSSTWSAVQLPIGAVITPIEWRVPRADLNKFGDTTYTDAPDLDCVWFRASAFDSRSVDNGTGPGARTIWLKLNPALATCPLPAEGPPGCGAVCGDGVQEFDEECDDGNNLNGDGCSCNCKLELPEVCTAEDNLLSAADGGVVPIVTEAWSDETTGPFVTSTAADAFDNDDGTFWNSDYNGPGFTPVEGYGDASYLFAEFAVSQMINQFRIVQDQFPAEAIDIYVTASGAAAKDSLVGWTQVASLSGLGSGESIVDIATVSALKVKLVFPIAGNDEDTRIHEFQARFCPPPPTDTLALVADDCQDDAFPGESGYQIEVELRMLDLTGLVTGFQAFVEFDDGVLSYRGDLSSYTNSPFPLHIQSIATAEVLAGQLNLDGSVDFLEPGTLDDALLATLVFDVDQECGTDTRVNFQCVGPFPTELSFEGDPVPTILEDSEPFTLDDTPPVITCPPDVTVECDASTDPIDTGSATATDNCDISPVIAYADLVPTAITTSNLDGWSLFATQSLSNTPGGDGSAEFVNGPATPPLGTGSAHLFTGTDGSQSAQMRNSSWTGTRIDELVRLEYSTYATQWNGSQLPYLTIWVDTDNDTVADDRLWFEPAYSTATYSPPVAQGPPALNTWQTWDTLNGNWYSDNHFGPGSAARPLADYLALEPEATIAINGALGGIRVASGFASPGDVFDANVDAFTIGTASNTVSYNFELSECADHVIIRTWTATDDCGNASSCDQTITVVDTTAPMITCPADVTVECDASTDPVNPTWSVQNIVDNDDEPFGLGQGPGSGEPRSVRGVALSPDGDFLYLGYNQHKQLRKIDLSVTDPADSCAVVAEIHFGSLTAGQQASYTGNYLPDAVDNPKAVATDDVGRVYVTRSTEIQVYDADLTGLLLSITGFSTTNGIHVARKDASNVYVYAADRGLPEVYRMVLADAAITGGGSVTRASVLDSTFDGDGIVDVGLDSAGAASNDLRGLASDIDGNVWAAENDGTLFEIIPAAADTASTVLKRALAGAFDVAIDGDRVYVSSGSRTVTIIDRNDINTVIDTLDPFAAPTGPDIDKLEPGVGSSTGIDLVPNEELYFAIEGGSSAPQSSESSFSDVNCGGADPNNFADDDNDPILRFTTALLPGIATATDNCDPSPAITFSDVETPGGCDQEKTITRTWTATDACDNFSQCVQTILVVDTTDPVITCPADTIVECDESTDPLDTGTATATDICDGSPMVTYSDNETPGSCPQEKTITRTWTATDDCGNSSECEQTITVVDTTDPVITCPADLTVECDESTDPSNTGMATATDNCDGLPMVTYSDDETPGSCPPEKTITRTWTATDACDNSSECEQTITVVDTTAPVIASCNATQSQYTVDGSCEAMVEFNATITDNCCLDADDVIANITLLTGNATLMFTAATDCTATQVDSKTVTVSCMAVVSDLTSCPATVQFTVDADDCCDNTAIQCMSTADIVDDTDPVLTCGDDIDQNADAGGCDAEVTWTAVTADDNCDGDLSGSVSYEIDLNDDTSVDATQAGTTYTFPTGTHRVTAKATDACGNTGMCDFTVTVNPVNDVDLVVELVGVNIPVMRCIHFQTNVCSNTADVTLSFVDHDGDDANGDGTEDSSPFGPSTPVRFVGTVEIPCGSWTSLCAKDEQHTEWDSMPISVSGTSYMAATLYSLEGGDTDNDGDVDINDVTLFLVQYNTAASDGGCPYDGTTRDADFSNDGLVFAEDYTFLQANWLTLSDCPCTVSSPRPGSWPNGVTSLAASALSAEMAALVDLNRDGIVDYKDVSIFEEDHALPNTLSSKMRETDRGIRPAPEADDGRGNPPNRGLGRGR